MQKINAQGGATIKASVDKNKILLGEPVLLSIEVYYSSESEKKLVEIDSIPHFEFLGKPVIDTIEQKNGMRIRSNFKITSFDSGHWVIPSFVLTSSAMTDTIPVDVVFSDFDPKREYHGLKEIIELPPPKKK
ncbi:MAG: hypothetical protein ACRDEB_10105, partial [Chitinophagaceae bacterium]